MQKRLKEFWIFQLGGWLALYVIAGLLYASFSPKISVNFFIDSFIEMCEGILLTRLLRNVIIRNNLLQVKIGKQILFIFLSSFVFAFLLSILNVLTEKIIVIPTKNKTDNELIAAWVSNFFIIFVWNLLYFSYHYVIQSNRERLDKAKLESLVKDLELKTIKAHINPHFIFNALNSIRYLIDENPAQARNAVTQLSILLRSSLHIEETSTTTLEKELEIVETYLNLEKLRFEERLHVHIQIAENTRQLPVPPMMLQTLVENAIKHGISRQIEGGIITIASQLEENNLKLVVKNSGNFLHKQHKHDGFGISGTKNRLYLMYGDKANFSIKEFSGNNSVEAEISIPVY